MIETWSIWHNYSTYFQRPVNDLFAAATNLIDSGVAELVFTSDGSIVWGDADSTAVTEVLDIDELWHKGNSDIRVPEALEKYAADCVVQAAKMRAYEYRILGDSVLEELPYIRAFIGECTLKLPDGDVRLYPQVKIYGNGVFLVEFRTLSGDYIYSSEALTDVHVNLYSHRADEVLVPTGLLKATRRPMLYESRLSLKGRAEAWKSVAADEDEIDKQSHTIESGDFHFRVASAFLPVGFSSYTLFSYVSQAVSHALSGYNQGLAYILRGAGGNPYTVGDWFGRPSVHLLRFDGQAKTFSQSLPHIRDDLAKIMARTRDLRSAATLDVLGKNYRSNFDDYGLYYNGSLALWVYSTSAFGSGKAPDNPVDELVLRDQILMEMVDFKHAAYRMAADRANSVITSVADALRERRQLARLESALRMCSRAGEIEDFFRGAWESLGLERVRSQVSENLSLSLSEVAEKRDYSSRRFEWILTVLFGLSGLSALAYGIIDPIWRFWGLPYSEGSPVQSLFELLVAFVITAGIIVMLAFSLKRGSKRRPGG